MKLINRLLPQRLDGTGQGSAFGQTAAIVLACAALVAAAFNALWVAIAALVLLTGVMCLLLAAASVRGKVAEQQIAEQTAAAAELAKAREAAEFANAAKTRYLVAVSHEIRSPLNAIYGYAQLLEREGTVPAAEAGGVIRRSAEHLTNLVEGLLDVSRIESGVLTVRSEIVPLPAFLDHVADMFRMQAAAKGLAFDYVVKGRLPRIVRTDEKRLRQILINLLSNAVKYTQAGGVTLSISYRSQVADIEVSDTGIGIAPEDMERVFEPFERGTSPEAQAQPGVGLGLAVTRVLARILGGEIFASSQPGLGSRFQLRVFLPEPNDAPAGTAEYRRVTGYAGARRTVVTIDDDPAQTSAIASLLRPLGFDVFTASHGEEGIALAGTCVPDVVLLDIQMPGISGWDVAARLRAEHGSALRIVMVSANAHEFRAGDEDGTDHDAFLTKPVDLQALLDVIGRQLQLEWQFASDAPVAKASANAALPKSAAPHIEALHGLAKVGHVRAMEETLVQLAGEVPESAAAVAAMREHLATFDLRSLVKLLDDVRPL